MNTTVFKDILLACPAVTVQVVEAHLPSESMVVTWAGFWNFEYIISYENGMAEVAAFKVLQVDY